MKPSRGGSAARRVCPTRARDCTPATAWSVTRAARSGSPPSPGSVGTTMPTR